MRVATSSSDSGVSGAALSPPGRRSQGSRSAASSTPNASAMKNSQPAKL